MDSENNLDNAVDEVIDDVLNDTLQEEEVVLASLKQEGNIIGDSEIFYDKESTDEVIQEMKLIHSDFSSYLYDVLDADGIFDNVIFPYSKGCLPIDKRFVKLKDKFFAQLEEAENTFYDTLDEIVDYIVDYSNNKNLTMNQKGTLNQSLGDEHQVLDDDIDDSEVLS